MVPLWSSFMCRNGRLSPVLCHASSSASSSSCVSSIRRVDAYYNNKKIVDGRAGPVDIVKEAVVCLRSSDIQGMESLILSEDASDSSPCRRSDRIRIGEDGGLLVSLKSVFDVGSRRLLPFNLLRRSQVLSVLSLDRDTCQVRTKISSKYGEEGIVVWNVERDGNTWRIVRVSREDTGECLPTTLHPVHSPESVIRAYLDWMKKKDYVQAHQLCEGIPFASMMMGPVQSHAVALSFLEPEQRALLDSFFDEHESYRCIVDHKEYVFGDAVLIDEQCMVQEVVVRDREGTWWHAAFELSIKQHHGCWSIDDIRMH
mmetsp:Transcript_6873/g.13666  ORF Transcript_6873/g.13666 Transcript_6873/m.13666 type:complete len:314 (-) Transcript_6873:186-1127(-)